MFCLIYFSLVLNNAQASAPPRPILSSQESLQADLVASEIKFYSPHTQVEVIPQAGQLVTCRAILKNQGGAPTPVFNVKWFIDERQVGYGSHGSLAPAQTSEGNVYFNWLPTSGIHSLRFVADCDNHVAESDETNNSYTKAVTSLIVPQADLIVSGIELSLEASALIPGRLVTCRAILKNQGGAPTPVFNVKWFIDERQVGYGSHGSLAPAQTSEGNVYFSWFPSQGTHTLKFVADCDNHVAESNEANNSYSGIYTINPILSISVSPKIWNIGSTQVNKVVTMSPGNKITITNDGSGPQTLELQLINPAGWSAANIPAQEAYVLSGVFCGINDILQPAYFNQDAANEDVITAQAKKATSTAFGYSQSTANGVAVPAAQARALYLQFKSPVVTNKNAEQNISVIVSCQLP